MSEFANLIRNLTSETYRSLRRAVEIGRWPDGRELTAEQRRLCMEAVIGWEALHAPESERTGYLPPVDCDSKQDTPDQTVTLRSARGEKDA